MLVLETSDFFREHKALPVRGITLINKQEPDELVASITPEKARQVALATWRKRRHRELRSVGLYYVVKTLVTDVGICEQSEYGQAWSRLREAVIATVNQANDMTYIEAT